LPREADEPCGFFFTASRRRASQNYYNNYHTPSSSSHFGNSVLQLRTFALVGPGMACGAVQAHDSSPVERLTVWIDCWRVFEVTHRSFLACSSKTMPFSSETMAFAACAKNLVLAKNVLMQLESFQEEQVGTKIAEYGQVIAELKSEILEALEHASQSTAASEPWPRLSAGWRA
jgi:hypothetical protein